jgi:calcineurin-like phosphoesterase family protein
MSDTFFISDMHFGHERMLTYENRPFNSLAELDETLIKNWNNKIKKQYHVYVLGDVSLYHKEKTKEIINQLNGYKILIMGNHDRHRSTKCWKDIGFQEVSKYPILFQDKFLLSHEPRYEIGDTNLYYNIHGHLHSHGSLYRPEIFYNVCVERNNYRPVDFDVIKKKLNILD